MIPTLFFCWNSRTFYDFQGPWCCISSTCRLYVMMIYLTVSNFVIIAQFYLIKAKHSNCYQFLVIDKYLAWIRLCSEGVFWFCAQFGSLNSKTFKYVWNDIQGLSSTVQFSSTFKRLNLVEKNQILSTMRGNLVFS